MSEPGPRESQSGAALTGGVLRVALDTPLRRLFDYLPPEPGAAGLIVGGLPVAPAPGLRIAVPFGRRRLVGLVIETDVRSEVPADKLRRAFELLDATPVADTRLLALLRWACLLYTSPSPRD